MADGYHAARGSRRVVRGSRSSHARTRSRSAKASYSTSGGGALSNLAVTGQSLLAAYARGVNRFIDTHRNACRSSSRSLRYDPRPWSVIDSVCIGLQMIRDLTTNWKDEVAKAGMLANGDAKLVSRDLPGSQRTGDRAGLECMGRFRQAYINGQADSRE